MELLGPALGCVVVLGTFAVIAVGILKAVDYVRRPVATNASAAILRRALRIPIFVLGVASLGVGGWILSWVVSNEFWERKEEYTRGPIAWPLILMGFGLSMIKVSLASDRGKTSTRPPEVAEPFHPSD